MMGIDARHKLLREKLDSMGFTQPLPIGSLAIVSALLDDIVLGTHKLKEAKQSIVSLQQEKKAWDLGVEPYKCDNSRLLAECNSLHLEMIRQKDALQQKIVQLNKQKRDVELENHELSERVIELERQLEDPKHRKHRNDAINLKRKPFISTVRSGDYTTTTLKSLENMENMGRNGAKCMCHTEKNDILSRLIAEQQANKLKTHWELIELYKSQLESRNREISRLNQLLTGGRPTTALAKDCCYRGISTLTDDVERLQREKSEMQAEYEQTLDSQQENSTQVARLRQQNQKLAAELKSLRETALSVESEANKSIEILHKKNAVLKIKLNESKKRADDLEKQLEDLLEGESKTSFRSMSAEIRFLHEKLDNSCEKEAELKHELEKLTKKNAKLKGKLSADGCKCIPSAIMHNRDASTMTVIDNERSPANSIDINRLKTDRDFYQQEYMRLLNRPMIDPETSQLRHQLMEKECEIKMLRCKLDGAIRKDSGMPCKSVEATICRLEREKNSLKCTIERITAERNDLRDKLQAATFNRNEREIERLQEKIRHLEVENLNLQTMQAPTRSTISALKEEIAELTKQNTELTEENSKLLASNQQFRVLQQQTEHSLEENQKRLNSCQRQLTQTESRFNVIDSSRTDGCKEIGELRVEINRLKIFNSTLEKDKDRLISELDVKTEKLFSVESKLDTMKARVTELESDFSTTHRQLNNAHADSKQVKCSLQQMTNEIEELRRQIKQSKTISDNAMHENRRLTNELADMECKNSLIKIKLDESEKEVDKVKRQLQQYVQEVQRAEDLLLKKEEERNDMLENYLTLSHDAVVLEGNNQSLELEAAHSKRAQAEMENNLASIQAQLNSYKIDIGEANDRITELTKQVHLQELEIEQYKHERNTARIELGAVKDLCKSIDVETDQMSVEVERYSDILHND